MFLDYIISVTYFFFPGLDIIIITLLRDVGTCVYHSRIVQIYLQRDLFSCLINVSYYYVNA